MCWTSVIAALIILCVGQAGLAPSARAQETAAQAPAGKLVKLVILSRHGVRSPIPARDELATWTSSKWPTWVCDGKECGRGQLTAKGRALAEQMGTYYRAYLSELVADGCPAASDVFFWADLDERTQSTGQALLRGLRPSCDGRRYFQTAPPPRDKIFHPVTKGGPCKLDAGRAEQEILALAGGDIATYIAAQKLDKELALAQKSLQCCACDKMKKACGKTQTGCSLEGIGSCLVRRPSGNAATQVQLGGGLRIASTYAELLLLEYANGFPSGDVGWGRLNRDELAQAFRIHTAAFDLEQRTTYVARLQGSMLSRKILLALRDESDGKPGTAPAGTKLVAYVGHDTNIANVAGMLGLTWQQEGYQRNQMPPAGALLFEVRETAPSARHVNVAFVAQSLDDMRNGTGTAPRRTPVPVPGCGKDPSQCPLGDFSKLVEGVLDANCAQ